MVNHQAKKRLKFPRMKNYNKSMTRNIPAKPFQTARTIDSKESRNELKVKPTAAQLKLSLKNPKIVKNGQLTSLKSSLKEDYQNILKPKSYRGLLRSGRFGTSTDVGRDHLQPKMHMTREDSLYSKHNASISKNIQAIEQLNEMSKCEDESQDQVPDLSSQNQL